MGYTHYFKTVKEPTTKQWRNIQKACKELLYPAFDNGILWQGHDTSYRPLIIDSLIAFNGVGDNAHEDFVLNRCLSNEFCKTARKPYDKYVVAVLLIAKFYAPECFEVSTDGGVDDWQAGKKLALSVVESHDMASVEVGQSWIDKPPTFNIDL